MSNELNELDTALFSTYKRLLDESRIHFGEWDLKDWCWCDLLAECVMMLYLFFYKYIPMTTSKN